MEEIKTIYIDTNLAIISARAKVRRLAQKAGLNTADQARISLATSILAHFLDLGGAHSGEISFLCLNLGDCPGVQVICVTKGRCPQQYSDDKGASTFGKLRWMVDELDVQVLPPNDVQVTLTKKVI